MIKAKTFCLLGGLALGVGQPLIAQEVSVDPTLFASGAALYIEHCSVCHGTEGDGKGPLATGFTPRPRDLTKGSFKFRSTQVGEFPTADDLTKTLKRGITGSYGQTMPSFDFLSDDEILALVEVVRFVAGIEEHGAPKVVPQRPTTPDLTRGEFLYTQLQCAGCHGESGDGQGDLARGLLDDTALQIKPADFRVGQFKGGNDPEDIWMRIYTGLDGTPMPSFGWNSSDDDIWSVVEYVIRFSE